MPFELTALRILIRGVFTVESAQRRLLDPTECRQLTAITELHRGDGMLNAVLTGHDMALCGKTRSLET